MKKLSYIEVEEIITAKGMYDLIISRMIAKKNGVKNFIELMQYMAYDDTKHVFVGITQDRVLDCIKIALSYVINYESYLYSDSVNNYSYIDNKKFGCSGSDVEQVLSMLNNKFKTMDWYKDLVIA